MTRESINVRKNIILCSGPTCMRGGEKLKERVHTELTAAGLQDQVEVILSGCLGMCRKGPILIVNPGYTLYGNVEPDDIPRIIGQHIVGDSPFAEKVIQEDHLFNRFFRIFGDIGFFGKQMRIALRNCGIIDPESIADYLSVRGYEALAKVLQEYTPQKVIEELVAAGLRGRGGAGFPTGLKWKLTAEAVGDEKYVICNADEGDPGAFMDRSAIEGDPHTILEGMLIGGYAVGARKGFIYIRAEYPLAIQRLKKAIESARREGFLGEHIMGSAFSFDIEIRLGAGAFVCGEETALIQSIEGKRGMPRPRPPYPSVEGLFGKPTLINNVETWANIPVIVLDGAEWFSSIGTEKSKGTKVFAVAGNVVNTGLVEVPMGTSLRDIVFDICGGIPEGRRFKAVQTGGPSGGCLTEAALDTKVDYESLAAAGSFMGSGGMIVMDEGTCMVNVARFFLEFTQNESCGKCTPCREGTKRMLEILTRIVDGRGEAEDIDKLIRLGGMISKASLCGLGRSAPNPVISTLTNFREEYEEHIHEKKCRAGVCTAMMRYEITDACSGCTACVRVCPVGAITGIRRNRHVIDQDRCIKCGECFKVCRFEAITRN
ncbi:MAG TPA: NADH-quinone oxidoreductase subunit NuoF [Spirochaetia bacterium]|nr:NADH-quinone oxidoreductase subunit NuoF [Spirochaetia bacterium]